MFIVNILKECATISTESTRTAFGLVLYLL